MCWARRTLTALFVSAAEVDTVSRVWRKTKRGCEVWNAYPLKPDCRWLGRAGGSIGERSRCSRAGCASDGEIILLPIKSMGGESEAASRALLDNLVTRGREASLPSLTSLTASISVTFWPQCARSALHARQASQPALHAPERNKQDLVEDETKDQGEAEGLCPQS
jgi:hypothetical protein